MGGWGVAPCPDCSLPGCEGHVTSTCIGMPLSLDLLCLFKREPKQVLS